MPYLGSHKDKPSILLPAHQVKGPTNAISRLSQRQTIYSVTGFCIEVINSITYVIYVYFFKDKF